MRTEQEEPPTVDRYQRRHQWMRTWPGERSLKGELLNDFVCIVEGEIVGRISEQETGPMRGTYKWDGGHSRRIRETILPQGGYAPDVQEAARKVEEHYDLVREAAKLPPVVGVMEKR